MLNYKKYNINQPIELPVLILDRKMDKEIIKNLPKKQMAGEHFWQSCYSHMGPLEFNKSDNRESTEMEIGALLHLKFFKMFVLDLYLCCNLQL